MNQGVDMDVTVEGGAGHMNQKRFDEAQKTVDAGRVAYARMQPPFDALAGQRQGANFERFYSLASANRALQQQVFEIGSVAIDQGSKSGEAQTKEYRASVEQWNALVGKYNDNIREMDRIVQEIVKEVRKRG